MFSCIEIGILVALTEYYAPENAKYSEEGQTEADKEDGSKPPEPEGWETVTRWVLLAGCAVAKGHGVPDVDRCGDCGWEGHG